MVSVTIGGALSSPYSMKLRAVLRYRRVPFRWVPRHSRWDDLPEVPVQIIPVLAFDDEDGRHRDAMVDSSPQIARLEAEHAGRSVVPTDPAVAFLDLLVEDYADEWVTKAMYHYRWSNAPDVEKAGLLLPLDRDLHLADEDLARATRYIIDRQVGRRALVGSTEANAPVIEASYRRLLDLLQRHLGRQPFLFGDRPGRGDFALYGQLKPLVWWDPTPMAEAVTRAPRAVLWVDRVDDLSWLPVEGDDGWSSIGDLPGTVHDLLAEIGRTYAPFLVANAAALADGAAEVACEIDGQEYRQAPFRYQAKCLGWLRDAHESLDPSSRATVGRLLDGTGCERLFA